MLKLIDRPQKDQPLDSASYSETRESHNYRYINLTSELATKMRGLLENKPTPITFNINLSEYTVDGLNLSKLFRDNNNPREIILNVTLSDGSVERVTFVNKIMPYTDPFGNKASGQVIYKVHKDESMSRVRDGNTIAFSNRSCLELLLSGETGMGYSATAMANSSDSIVVSPDSIVASVSTINYLDNSPEQNPQIFTLDNEKSLKKPHIVEFDDEQNGKAGLHDFFNGRVKEAQLYVEIGKRSYTLRLISKSGKFFWVKDDKSEIEINHNAIIQFKNMTRNQKPYSLSLSNSERRTQPKYTSAISFDVEGAKKLDPEFVALVVSTIVNYLTDRFGIEMKPEYFAGDGFILPLSNLQDFLETQIVAEWFLRDLSKEFGLNLKARIAYAGCSLTEEQTHKAVGIQQVQKTQQTAALVVADVVQSTAKEREENDYVDGTCVFSVMTPQALDNYLLSLGIDDQRVFESIKNQLLQSCLIEKNVGVVGGTEKIELGETDVYFVHNPSFLLPFIRAIIKDLEEKKSNN